jgi:hypothetical protein
LLAHRDSERLFVAASLGTAIVEIIIWEFVRK